MPIIELLLLLLSLSLLLFLKKSLGKGNSVVNKGLNATSYLLNFALESKFIRFATE